VGVIRKVSKVGRVILIRVSKVGRLPLTPRLPAVIIIIRVGRIREVNKAFN
jgi:hypothetical protein